MSLIYSILKPVLSKVSAGRAVMTREVFVRQAEKKQRRNLTFSEIDGYEKLKMSRQKHKLRFKGVFVGQVYPICNVKR